MRIEYYDFVRKCIHNRMKCNALNLICCFSHSRDLNELQALVGMETDCFHQVVFFIFISIMFAHFFFLEFSFFLA
jgi:hypothetical protein